MSNVANVVIEGSDQYVAFTCECGERIGMHWNDDDGETCQCGRIYTTAVDFSVSVDVFCDGEIAL